jgi:DNA repair protein RadD
MQLRPYQLELIDAVWSAIHTGPTALAQLPTGGGKTMCFSHLLRRAMDVKPDIRCGVVMGRVDLVNQTERALARVIERRHLGVYCGSLGRKELGRPVTIASIQSIDTIRAPRMSLLIVDEAHNFDQRQGAYLRFIERARAENPMLKVVGFTATPFRSKGLIYGEDMFFRSLCYRKTIQDMIAMGYLCRPVLRQGEGAFDTDSLRTRAGEYMQEDVDALVSDEDKVRAQVRDALSKLGGRQSVAWATANIEHCSRVTDMLMREGEISTQVHSKQDRATRDASLAAFMAGSCRHMVFVSVLSEGFDHPPIDAVVLMRPTRSPVLYVQTVGRGLRTCEGKRDCLVLDYGQVVRELGPLDDPKVKGKAKEGDAVLKCCPRCMSWIPGGHRECPECGHAFPPPEPVTEKLTKRADTTAKILSDANRPETETLGPVSICMHVARSGNLCVRITYQDRGISTRWGYGGVSEFFVTTSPWAMERLEQRLGALDASIPGIPFEGEVVVQGSFEVVKRLEGKYDRVLSVRRLSEETPSAPVGFGGEEDASFDFGANARPGAPADIGF